MKVWSTTILSVYRYLETISKSIDNLILRKSINSSFYNNGRFVSTFQHANSILALTERKVNLINLKILVEETLLELTPLQKRLLTLYYIDGLKSSECLEILNISSRTFFRKKSESITSFSKVLLKNGYTNSKLFSMFRNEHWLNNLYIRNTENQKFEFEPNQRKDMDYKFLRNVIREFNMVNSFS